MPPALEYRSTIRVLAVPELMGRSTRTISHALPTEP
jgi:hypothetical protein